MIKEIVLAVGMALNVDLGGSIIERMQTIELLEKADVPVEISGICMSACTMYLGLPKVCVHPKTILGFHSAYSVQDGIPVPSLFGNSVLMEYYPDYIDKWVIEKKALSSIEMTFLGAQEAWRLGVKKCEEKEIPVG